MTNRNILIKEGRRIAILDLKKYKEMVKKLKEYEKKEKLLKSLKKFEILAKWGRGFAKRKKITPQEILEND